MWFKYVSKKIFRTLDYLSHSGECVFFPFLVTFSNKGLQVWTSFNVIIVHCHALTNWISVLAWADSVSCKASFCLSSKGAFCCMYIVNRTCDAFGEFLFIIVLHFGNEFNGKNSHFETMNSVYTVWWSIALFAIISFIFTQFSSNQLYCVCIFCIRIGFSHILSARQFVSPPEKSVARKRIAFSSVHTAS